MSIICSINRKVAELGVSQIAILVHSVEIKSAVEKMEFKCEKSIGLHLGFSFFLMLNKYYPSSHLKIERTD